MQGNVQQETGEDEVGGDQQIYCFKNIYLQAWYQVTVRAGNSAGETKHTYLFSGKIAGKENINNKIKRLLSCFCVADKKFSTNNEKLSHHTLFDKKHCLS